MMPVAPLHDGSLVLRQVGGICAKDLAVRNCQSRQVSLLLPQREFEGKLLRKGRKESGSWLQIWVNQKRVKQIRVRQFRVSAQGGFGRGGDAALLEEEGAPRGKQQERGRRRRRSQSEVRANYRTLEVVREGTVQEELEALFRGRSPEEREREREERAIIEDLLKEEGWVMVRERERDRGTGGVGRPEWEIGGRGKREDVAVRGAGVRKDAEMWISLQQEVSVAGRSGKGGSGRAVAEEDVSMSRSNWYTTKRESAGGRSSAVVEEDKGVFNRSFFPREVDLQDGGAGGSGGGGRSVDVLEREVDNLAKEVFHGVGEKVGEVVLKSEGRPSLLRSPQPAKIAQPLLVQELEVVKEAMGLGREAAREAVEEGETAVEEQLKKARAMMKDKSSRLVQARVLLQQLAKKHPLNANLWVHYAQLERLSGDIAAARCRHEESIQIFEYWRDYGSQYIRALQAWATLECQNGQVDTARWLFKKAIRASSRVEVEGEVGIVDAEVAGLHAWAMLEKKHGSWVRARELLEKAEQLQPLNPAVLSSRALVEKLAHNFGLARQYFRRATKAAPTDVISWQAWGVMEAELGNVKRMRQLFQKALNVAPASVHTLQAWAHHEAKISTEESLQRARDLYQRCVESAPESVFAWQAWAVLEQKAGDLNKARQLYRQGLQASPADVACLQAYARLEWHCGNVQGARDVLALALAEQPNNAAALQLAAEVEGELGHMEASKQLFIRAGLADRVRSRRRRDMFEKRKNESKRKFASGGERGDEVEGRRGRERVREGGRKGGHEL